MEFCPKFPFEELCAGKLRKSYMWFNWVCSFQLKAGLVSSGVDTGKGKSKMSKHITHGFHCIKGKSNHDMEDYVVSEFKKKDDSELGLFAIFDGHLGHDVAKYLQNHLFDNILKEVEISLILNI